MPRSLECYHQAVDKADTTDADCDYLLLGKVHGQMAYIYNKVGRALQTAVTAGVRRAAEGGGGAGLSSCAPSVKIPKIPKRKRIKVTLLNFIASP